MLRTSTSGFFFSFPLSVDFVAGFCFGSSSSESKILLFFCGSVRFSGTFSSSSGVVAFRFVLLATLKKERIS
jgi:biotin transporter BioY